ncbi:MAG: hypothetical protein PHY12_01045, partial [Eubacteriales bacterium]|nr:hypothetical protein [Eubacteriales bacterium]
SESPATHRSMYIAVLFASINLLGVALGNTVGGYLMQDVFSVWAESKTALWGITMTNSHYMFLATMALRVLVCILFLPRITEQGAWKLGAMLRDMWLRTKTGFQRRIFGIRAYVLRKRARRKMERERED